MCSLALNNVDEAAAKLVEPDLLEWEEFHQNNPLKNSVQRNRVFLEGDVMSMCQGLPSLQLGLIKPT